MSFNIKIPFIISSHVQRLASSPASAARNKSKAGGIWQDTSAKDLKYDQAGTVRTVVNTDGTQTLTGKTITGPANSSLVITTKGVTAAESGSTFFLDLAAGFVTTLPAVALGLEYTFIVKTAPTGSYTIVCPAAATLFKGHVLTNDVNSATDSDFGTAGEATVTFVLNKSVAGDRAHVVCDGVNWHVSAECSVFDAITIS